VAKFKVDANEWRLYWMVSGGSVFGYLSAFMLPVLVGPLIEGFQFNEYEVGIIFSLELSGIALAAIISALRAHSANLRTIGIVGVALACFGHGVSILADSVPVFGLARVLAGVGEGAVLAATFAAAAKAVVPERAFAISQIVIVVIAMVLLVATPHLVALWDYRAGIAAILVALVLFSPSVLVLPTALAEEIPGTKDITSSSLPYLLVGTLVLVVYILMNIADMGIWAFSERTGTLLGISPYRIGEVLATAQFLGIATIGAFSLPLVTLFFWPYLLGALAALDDRGVWTALGGAASAAGVAIGPLLAGYLAERFSYREMTWILCLIVLIGLVLIHIANRRPSPWHAEPRSA
jgi:predicted MFS family arabinose efflux permease